MTPSSTSQKRLPSCFYCFC